MQRLFNVDPNLIAEAQAQFQGVGEQLDYILGRMGATEEGAKEMADAWVGVKNELRLALTDGFTPLLETIQPLLVQFRSGSTTPPNKSRVAKGWRGRGAIRGKRDPPCCSLASWLAVPKN